MIDKCIDWIKKSTQRADAYYSAMTRWVTTRRTVGSVSDLITLAGLYQKALDKALTCLRKLKRSKSVEEEIEKTQDYKALVRSDLELLNDIKA